MKSAKSYDTNERAFRNQFGLVKVFTSKLNRESALAAKVKILKHQHFLKVMKRSNDEKEANVFHDNDHFFRQA